MSTAPTAKQVARRRYEAQQAPIWRAAWERFFTDLWEPIPDDELDAFIDYTYAAKADASLWNRLVEIRGTWEREAGLSEAGADAWHTFTEALEKAWPLDPDRLDLKLWPEAVPQAPPDDGTEGVLWEICRRDKGKSEDERLAAGWVLTQLAMIRAARIYSGA